MSIKMVVGILLLLSVFLAGTAQASKVVLMDGKDAGTTQASITSWSDTQIRALVAPLWDFEQGWGHVN